MGYLFCRVLIFSMCINLCSIYLLHSFVNVMKAVLLLLAKFKGSFWLCEILM